MERIAVKTLKKGEMLKEVVCCSLLTRSFTRCSSCDPNSTLTVFGHLIKKLKGEYEDDEKNT